MALSKASHSKKGEAGAAAVVDMYLCDLGQLMCGVRAAALRWDQVLRCYQSRGVSLMISPRPLALKNLGRSFYLFSGALGVLCESQRNGSLEIKWMITICMWREARKSTHCMCVRAAWWVRRKVCVLSVHRRARGGVCVPFSSATTCLLLRDK